MERRKERAESREKIGESTGNVTSDSSAKPWVSCLLDFKKFLFVTYCVGCPDDQSDVSLVKVIVDLFHLHHYVIRYT